MTGARRTSNDSTKSANAQVSASPRPVQLTLLPGKKRDREAKPKASAPVWSNYSAQRRMKCADCLAECGRDPAAPAAKPAQRRLRAPGVDLLLCHQHAIARGDTQLRRRHRAAG